MNEIMIYIHHSKIDFYKKFNRMPTIIYAGRYEIDCIDRYMRGNPLEYPMLQEPNRLPTLFGLELIKVDTVSHINVAEDSLWKPNTLKHHASIDSIRSQ
jgi:hypothetical protein